MSCTELFAASEVTEALASICSVLLRAAPRDGAGVETCVLLDGAGVEAVGAGADEAKTDGAGTARAGRIGLEDGVVVEPTVG